MLAACIEGLAIRPDGVYVDGTFGRGGHSAAILAALGPAGRLIAMDRDPQAVAVAREWSDPRFEVVWARFSDIADVLNSLKVACVDGVLLDLGVSSPQLDDPARGFSFRSDGPLDMRMDPAHGQSAREWLQQASESDIAEALKSYGEERFAVPIAKAIAARRQERGPLASTAELAELVAGTVKTREPGQNPATRTFQALRIFVNAELEELEQALEASLNLLEPQGRLVVISFHSLEDRIVKQFIAKHAREVVDRRVPFAVGAPLKLAALDRVKPSAEEVAANPRARSAIMRVAQRTAH